MTVTDVAAAVINGSSIFTTTGYIVSVYSYKCRRLYTPGGDGVNEFFFPLITAGFEVSDYRFDIYNRWGELIFTSTNREEGRNGAYRSQQCQVDTYVRVLRLTESGTTNVHSLNGHVNILK